MATTIQISEKLQDELSKRKFFERETYEEIIWGLIEDAMEVDIETKKDLIEARAEIKSGKYKTFSQAKKELGI